MAKFTEQILPSSVLNSFKYEVANELGITDKLANTNGDWAQLSSHDNGRVGGKIGGSMVKVMIQQAETMLANKYQ